MSVGVSGRRSQAKNRYAPLYAPLLVHEVPTSQVDSGPFRRVASVGERSKRSIATHRERRIASLDTYSLAERLKDDDVVNDELSQVVQDLKRALRGTGNYVWKRLWGGNRARARDGTSPGAVRQGRVPVQAVKGRKRKRLSEPFAVPVKTKKGNGPGEEPTKLAPATSSPPLPKKHRLVFSKDPFHWDSWHPSTVTQAGGDHDDQAENVKPLQQYGTALIPRKRLARFATAKKNNGASTIIEQLKKVYNGEYEIPQVLVEEKRRQLALLQQDKQSYNDSQAKKQVVGLAEKIRDLFASKPERPESSEADIVFLKENRVDVLEQKRRDFYQQRFRFDKIAAGLQKEFTLYHDLLEEREKAVQRRRRRSSSSASEEAQRAEPAHPHLITAPAAGDLAAIEATFARRDNAVLADAEGIEIKVHDFKTLAPGRWLNDTVIEFFMKTVERTTPRVVAFNSFFYTSLSERGYQGVRRWLKRKKAKIQELDKIFVPINLNQSHWALCVADMQAKTIAYVDSLSNGPTATSFAIQNDVQHYVIEESQRTLGSDFQPLHLACPQQSNGFDCGIYVCMNVLHLAKNAPLTFGSRDAATMRNYMANLILHGSSSSSSSSKINSKKK